MKFLRDIFLTILLCSSVYAKSSKEIALSFDDCPRKIGPLFNGIERANKLIKELKRAKVPQAVFFCNSPTRESDGASRLMLYAQQGHLIANHTATHPSLNKTDVNEYIKDIEVADKELNNYPNFRKWFRFPYLHEGKNESDVITVRNFLNSIGYNNGYVTVDNQDWYIDDLLSRSLADGKKIDYKKLCTVYKNIMLDEVKFYDNMSLKALGRSVKHVILLHETDLNAICIADLVFALRSHKWKIISPDLAYTDPIAQKEPSANGTLNQGRVFALAKESGYKGPYWSKWNEEEDIDKEFLRQKVWK